MTRLLGALSFLAACARPGPVQSWHDKLVRDIDKAHENEWALRCAPRELALAEANRDFAEIEFRQGHVLRAQEHLLAGREAIAVALERAEECRPKDRDGDGITDDADACPDEPENFDGYKDGDGCPEHDRDHDGITDDADACPDDPEDLDSFKDGDGCPELDNDADGLVDSVDRCPNEAEDLNGYQDDDGCPEGVVDRDGDGILDAQDACPDEPENLNEYLDQDGCPDVKPQKVRITKERIEIDEKILFETAKARILPESYGILDAVAQVMRDYPHIKVRIEGHTDSQGSDAYNMKLSQARAEAVREYLVQAGIAPERLVAVGYGETRPIDTNRTAQGRANNRRVEFHIVEGME